MKTPKTMGLFVFERFKTHQHNLTFAIRLVIYTFLEFHQLFHPPPSPQQSQNAFHQKYSAKSMPNPSQSGVKFRDNKPKMENNRVNALTVPSEMSKFSATPSNEVNNCNYSENARANSVSVMHLFDEYVHDELR